MSSPPSDSGGKPGTPVCATTANTSTSGDASGERAAPCDPRLVAPDAAHAHHIHEFGEVDRIVHVAASEASAAEEADPVLPVSVKSPHARSERWRRLVRRCYRPRHLMQYFYNETLYRTVGLRKVTTEELFLDLVIVAAIAALGHELRESPITWRTVEKFLLLFAAVYSSWRQVVLLWNLWGISQDLVEKAGIYVTFMALTGIALGAHNAFDNLARPYVAASAFLASAVPISGMMVLASRERLLKNPKNRINQVLLNSSMSFIGILPYFAAAFVRSDTATRVLYWIACGFQFLLALAPFWVFHWLHRNVSNFTRTALNIELFVEKFEVLTMIVMGETMIGLLFEAGAALLLDGVRVGYMYASAVAATLTLYSLQTLYVQIDSPIQKGGAHAIRHNAYAGFSWNFLHMPYHFFLILFATGLSISFRDVAILPVESAVEAVVRAKSDAAAGAAQFSRNARWIFSTGWGGAVICSGLLGALHRPGPRAATKLHRIIIRCAIATGLMVGLPFSDVSAGWYQGITAMVSAAMSLTEYLFVQMDRIGFFRSEASRGGFTSSESAAKESETARFDDSFSESSEMDPDFDLERPRPPDDNQVSLDRQEGHSANDEFIVALKERLCKGHCKRMVAVCPSKAGAEHNRGSPHKTGKPHDEG